MTINFSAFQNKAIKSKATSFDFSAFQKQPIKSTSTPLDMSAFQPKTSIIPKQDIKSFTGQYQVPERTPVAQQDFKDVANMAIELGAIVPQAIAGTVQSIREAKKGKALDKFEIPLFKDQKLVIQGVQRNYEDRLNAGQSDREAFIGSSLEFGLDLAFTLGSMKSVARKALLKTPEKLVSRQIIADTKTIRDYVAGRSNYLGVEVPPELKTAWSKLSSPKKKEVLKGIIQLEKVVPNRLAKILGVSEAEITKLVPKTRIVAEERRLPGYAPEGKPAFGLSIEPRKPVGFGESKVKQVETFLRDKGISDKKSTNIAEKMQKLILGKSKNVEADITFLADTINPSTRLAFQEITGIKLDKTQKKAQQQIRDLIGVEKPKAKWLTKGEVKKAVDNLKGKKVIVDLHKRDFQKEQKVYSTEPIVYDEVWLEGDTLVRRKGDLEWSSHINNVRDFVVDGKSMIGDLQSEKYAKSLFKQPTPTPKPTLQQEAKQYKSADEFYETMPNKLRDDLRAIDVKGKQQITSWFDKNVSTKTDTLTGAMQHRPSKSGIGSNIESKEAIPDFYKRPELYKYSNDGTYDESIKAIMSIKGKPNADITIYRASPKNELRNGDWITLSKKYAKQESLAENVPVNSFKVKAKEIQFAGDDINEFGYFGKDIWEKAQASLKSEEIAKKSPQQVDHKPRKAKVLKDDFVHEDSLKKTIPQQEKLHKSLTENGRVLLNEKGEQVFPKPIKENPTPLENPVIHTKLTDIEKETLLRTQIEESILEEQIRNHPAKTLKKYFSYKIGALPEVTGKGTSKFAKKGDDIVTELGYKDTETAREDINNLFELENRLKTLKNESKDLTLKEKDEEALRKLSFRREPKETKIKTTDYGINKKHGHTDIIIENLKKKGLNQEEINDIVLESGDKLIDTVKVKREKNGVLSATIRKDTLKEMEEDFTLDLANKKWIPTKTAMQKIKEGVKGGKETALDYYELPQIFFDRTGLRDYFYDPIREAERNAQDMKTAIFNEFEKAGLLNRGGWFTAERFNISKKEAQNIGKYYLTRQNKGGATELTDLTSKEKKFVKVFDNVIKESEERFYKVSKLNGKSPGKVKNYAPIMTNEDYKLAQEVGDMDFIFRKHPAFFSLKKRAEKVPFEMYELDYRKVASRWIDQMANFNHLGEVGVQIKYLANSDQFKDIVGDKVFNTTNKWLQNKFNPQVLSPAEKGGRFLRQKTAIASLGLNLASVLKQTLTQVPLTIIEKAPPKLKSKFAKDFGIKVSDLASLKERRGNVSIMDMQQGLNKAFVGPLSEFDKTNAQLSLNRLLDKNYKKVLKEGKEVSPEIQAQIIKQAQDVLDMWYGGMTTSQLPQAFRTELGKLINMFIYPLTSQLNGFIYSVAKAKGFSKAEKFAEVMASVLVIAYMEQVITNLSPKWSDSKEMTEDTLASLAGNIPILSQAVFAIRTDQPLTVSPILSSLRRTFQQTSKYFNEQVTAGDMAFAWGELFGMPKAIRRATQGVEMIKEEGLRDKNGKLLAPVKGSWEQIRAFLRGKYGTIATQDYARNIGVKSENREWFVPEVEFLQNAGPDGTYGRKAELYNLFDKETQDELYNELSEGQQKKLDKALKTTKTNPTEKEFIEKLRKAVENGEITKEKAKIFYQKYQKLQK